MTWSHKMSPIGTPDPKLDTYISGFNRMSPMLVLIQNSRGFSNWKAHMYHFEISLQVIWQSNKIEKGIAYNNWMYLEINIQICCIRLCDWALHSSLTPLYLYKTLDELWHEYKISSSLILMSCQPYCWREVIEQCPFAWWICSEM